MSIAEKLQTIAENEQKVYDAGYEKGKAEGGFDYTKYAKSLTFDNSFSEVTEDVYLDLSKSTTLSSCMKCSVNCEKVTVKISNLCTNLNWAFAGNTPNNQEALKIIEILGDTSGVTNFADAFRNRRNLESILGEIDFSGVTQSRFVSGMWINNEKMKEIYPKAETIKVSIGFSAFANPPDECINAIINGLADLTGQESQIVTLHSTVKAKLTDDQIAQITNKNWTLA